MTPEFGLNLKQNSRLTAVRAEFGLPDKPNCMPKVLSLAEGEAVVNPPVRFDSEPTGVAFWSRG